MQNCEIISVNNVNRVYFYYVFNNYLYTINKVNALKTKAYLKCHLYRKPNGRQNVNCKVTVTAKIVSGSGNHNKRNPDPYQLANISL